VAVVEDGAVVAGGANGDDAAGVFDADVDGVAAGACGAFGVDGDESGDGGGVGDRVARGDGFGGGVPGVGWGRAGYVPEIGIPLRYVSISLPAFISAYLLWTVSTSRWAAAVQRGLAIVMLALLPTNTVAGHRFFADWYHEGMTEVRADLMRGVPIDQLARRHQPFLVHWWRPSELELRMRMLQDAGIGPFAERVSPAADGR